MAIKIDSKKREVIVIPIFSEDNKVRFFDKKKRTEIEKEIKEFKFKSENGEILYIKINKQKIVLLGFKKDYNLENLRNNYSTLFSFLKSKKINEAVINIPKEDAKEIRAVIDGIDLTDYKFDKYIKKEKEEKIDIFLNISDKFNSLLKKTLRINSNVKLVRDLVNENASVITPQKLESIAKKFATKHKLKSRILDEKKILKENLNLIYNVGKGSVHPPRIIIIEYNANPKSKEKIALVGKGITFDSGGLNIKPTNYIETMKLDMGGAATVFGTFKTAVELKIKKNLVLVMGCAENAIDANSYKPGDVIESHSKKTVEVANTDAEGRLVLADCLSYVQKHYKPTHIIDLATLTGACLVALGPSLIAIMGNDSQTNREIFEAGELTGDRGWELPIHNEHREMNKSKIADIKNLGGRYAGTITAGAFLEAFIDKDVKWTHLDIAGAAFVENPHFHKYNGIHATGVGVRLLIDYLQTEKSKYEISKTNGCFICPKCRRSLWGKVEALEGHMTNCKGR